MKNRLSRLASLICAVGIALGTLGPLTVTRPAVAQAAADIAKARALYKEGLSLEAAGDWAGALAKFDEVGRIKLTPQVRFHVARCKENLGRLTEALGEYRLAEYEAQQAKAKELGEITQAREQLEARVPKVVIKRGEGASSAKIELDGVALGEAQLGKEVSVDPGPHRVVAKLAGGEFEQSVTLAEGESKEVVMTPPEGFKGSKAAPPGDDEPDKTEPGDTGTPAPAEKKGKGALPWIIGGVGVVGLVAGGYFFLQKNKAEQELDDVCRSDGTCPASKQSVQDDGKRYALLTNIGVGVGVVGIGVAAVLLLSGGSQEKAAKSNLRVDVIPGPKQAGVNVVGRF